MTPDFALDNVIVPALTLLPQHLNSSAARIEMRAIGLQESGFKARRQMGNGPATGFWQFEQGGGVRGVVRHHSSAELARLICHARDCEFSPRAIWAQLEHDDILAAAFARLLLLTDPKPLPPIGDADAAWLYYLKNWRPGRPHVLTWKPFYDQAVALVMGD
jgi:hypothetical protein